MQNSICLILSVRACCDDDTFDAFRNQAIAPTISQRTITRYLWDN